MSLSDEEMEVLHGFFLADLSFHEMKERFQEIFGKTVELGDLFDAFEDFQLSARE